MPSDYLDHTRPIEADMSLPALRIIRVLDRIADQRGYPQRVRVDNGPEFTSQAFQEWAQALRYELTLSNPVAPLRMPILSVLTAPSAKKCLIFICLVH
jgi:putative transposase